MLAFPEHSGLPRAGFMRRMGAILYDSLVILAVLMFAAALALGAVALLVSAEVIALAPGQDHAAVLEGNLLFLLYLIGVSFLFYGGFWVRGGQTLGMRAWRMKVQNADGSCISWKQAAIRFATAAFGLSNLGVLIDRRRMAWQDKTAGCEVVVLSAEANQLRNWRRAR